MDLGIGCRKGSVTNLFKNVTQRRHQNYSSSLFLMLSRTVTVHRGVLLRKITTFRTGWLFRFLNFDENTGEYGN